MIKYISLLLFIGLAWGQSAPIQPNGFQDVLILKTGEAFTGSVDHKVNGEIVFFYYNQYLQLTQKNFQINDIETIVTKNGTFTYPFDAAGKKGLFGFKRQYSGIFYITCGSAIASIAYALVNGL
tara:strand:- start:68 stop:439 length:372 start_codon:yes stop_codon:yes gene_type:complete